MPKDKILYDRLGLSTDSNVEEIKKAGRKMSMKWHPDKYKDEEKEMATSRFKEVREAIEILEDPIKRNRYDQVGLDGINNTDNGLPSSGFPFPGGFPGFAFPRGFSQQQSEKVGNVNLDLKCSLEQIIRQETVFFEYNQFVTCNECDGEGSKNGIKKDCAGCHGQGMVTRTIQVGPMTQQTIGPCDRCKGKGKIIEDKNKCKTCNGETYIVKVVQDSIHLKNDIETNMKACISKKGHQLKNGISDLIVTFQVEGHEVFTRKRSNLFVEIELTLCEALFGFTKIVYHLDGRKIQIQYNGKTEYGIYRKLVGEGLTDHKSGKRGNLYIHFTFNLPEISNIDELYQLCQYELTNNKNNVDDLEYAALIDIEKNEFYRQEEHEHKQEQGCKQM